MAWDSEKAEMTADAFEQELRQLVISLSPEEAKAVKAVVTLMKTKVMTAGWKRICRKLVQVIL